MHPSTTAIITATEYTNGIFLQIHMFRFFMDLCVHWNARHEYYYFASLGIFMWSLVLGPRLKVINLNILPESSRNELKCSLKIAFMFLSIILKFQVPDVRIFLGIRKKATVFDGPWSASQVGSMENP